MSKKSSYVIIYILMALLLAACVCWNLLAGSVNISVVDVLGVVSGKITTGREYSIVHDIRFPRIIAAVILGGALSVSGMLLQTFFANPIAGPFVLGISSGAKMAVALFMIIMLRHRVSISSVGMITAAFIGAVITTGFVLLISLRTRKMSLLIVCGILVGYICSAITDLVVTFADDSNIVNLHNWSMGSFSGMNWDNVLVMTVVIFISITAVFLLSKPISAYQLGEGYAISMGVNVKLLKVVIILLSSILSATVTAFAGPISFVGIAVPHLVKSVTKTTKPLIHIPGCFLGGAVVTLACDGLSRVIFAPTELSIGTVTAVLLVPVVIWMMLKSQGAHNE